jgi:SWI/SNF-related matrix-associated actin-dependent regulator 1 of chromatin subfamily A
MLVQQRQKELHDRLRASVMVRRLKADVLKDLPSKRRQIILVEPANAKSLIAAENAVLNKKRAELMALKHENAVQKLQVFRGAALAEISRIRHETALAKVPAVIDHLFDMLDQCNKIFVCVHHHDVGDAIAAALPAVTVQFDGRVDQKERDARVARFQTDKSVRVFVGSIRAAGLGLTLTAASVVLFAELDWTPAAMVQAEDRLHRIGQKDSVLVHHLVIDGSIDQKMAQILIDKSIMIDSILDGKVPETMNQNILDEVLK